MEDKRITLTHELIEAGVTIKTGSGNGAWTKDQLSILGVSWPPKKGWKTKLVKHGHKVSREEYERFLAIRAPDPDKENVSTLDEMPSFDFYCTDVVGWIRVIWRGNGFTVQGLHEDFRLCFRSWDEVECLTCERIARKQQP